MDDIFVSLVKEESKKGQKKIDPIMQELVRDGSVETSTGIDDSYTFGDLSRAGFQGATFGFGDELEAAVRYPFEKGGYKDIRNRIRGEMDQFSKNHPVKSISAELAGGAATGGLGVGRTLAKKGVDFGIKNLLKLGAAEGAVAGAGYADELQDVPLGVTVGAGIGAAAGGVTGVGANFIREFVKGSPKTQAGRQILQALKNDNITPQQAIQELRKIGDEAILADVSPNLQSLARAASNQPGASKKAAIDVLNKRQSGQQGRLTRASEDATGLRGDPLAATDDLVALRSQQASDLYSQAYQVPVTVSDGMVKEIGLNQQAAKKAAEWYERETGRKVNINNARSIKSITDLKFWDYWKRAIDDQIDTAKRSGAGNEARILTKSKNAALQDFDSEIYRQARKAYEVPTRMMDAIEKGKKIFSTKYAEDMEREISKMSDDEHKAFIVGALRELRERINRGPESAGNARNLIKSPAFREKLRNVFPDDASFNRFIRTAENEARMTGTYNIVHPNMNSKTAGVLADQASASRMMSPLIDLLSGRPAQAVGGMVRNARNAPQLLSPKVNEELSNLLFRQGLANTGLLDDILTAGSATELLAPGALGLLSVSPHQLFNKAN